tara:strand:- start:506 stop:697 length:192 start_codon:yes stop_codon:yes gene_type:complete
MALDKKYTNQLLDDAYREIMNLVPKKNEGVITQSMVDIQEILDSIDDVQYKIEILGEDNNLNK